MRCSYEEIAGAWFICQIIRTSFHFRVLKLETFLLPPVFLSLTATMSNEEINWRRLLLSSHLMFASEKVSRRRGERVSNKKNFRNEIKTAQHGTLSKNITSRRLKNISKWFIVASSFPLRCCKALFLPLLAVARWLLTTKVSDVIRCEIDTKWSVAFRQATKIEAAKRKSRMTKYLELWKKNGNLHFQFLFSVARRSYSHRDSVTVTTLTLSEAKGDECEGFLVDSLGNQMNKKANRQINRMSRWCLLHAGVTNFKLKSLDFFVNGSSVWIGSLNFELLKVENQNWRTSPDGAASLSFFSVQS